MALSVHTTLSSSYLYFYLIRDGVISFNSQHLSLSRNGYGGETNDPVTTHHCNVGLRCANPTYN